MRKPFPFWTNNNNNRQKSLLYLCCASFIVFFSRQICGWTNQSKLFMPDQNALFDWWAQSRLCWFITQSADCRLLTADWATNNNSKEKFMNFDFESIDDVNRVLDEEYINVDWSNAMSPEQWFVLMGKGIDEFPYNSNYFVASFI